MTPWEWSLLQPLGPHKELNHSTSVCLWTLFGGKSKDNLLALRATQTMSSLCDCKVRFRQIVGISGCSNVWQLRFSIRTLQIQLIPFGCCWCLQQLAKKIQEAKHSCFFTQNCRFSRYRMHRGHGRGIWIEKAQSEPMAGGESSWLPFANIMN